MAGSKEAMVVEAVTNTVEVSKVGMGEMNTEAKGADKDNLAEVNKEATEEAAMTTAEVVKNNTAAAATIPKAASASTAPAAKEATATTATTCKAPCTTPSNTLAPPAIPPSSARPSATCKATKPPLRPATSMKTTPSTLTKLCTAPTRKAVEGTTLVKQSARAQRCKRLRCSVVVAVVAVVVVGA